STVVIPEIDFYRPAIRKHANIVMFHFPVLAEVLSSKRGLSISLVCSFFVVASRQECSKRTLTSHDRAHLNYKMHIVLAPAFFNSSKHHRIDLIKPGCG